MTTWSRKRKILFFGGVALVLLLVIGITVNSLGSSRQPASASNNAAARYDGTSNGVVARFDANNDNIISKEEAIAAVRAYLADQITKEEAIAVIIAYFASPTPEPTATPTPTPAEERSDMIERVRPAAVKVMTPSSQGSGVIFKTEEQNGYIVTNQHVVGQEKTVTIKVGDATDYTGTVLGVDTQRDLAVVRICCADFTAIGFADSAGLRIGNEVLAVGYPRSDWLPFSTPVRQPLRVFIPGSMTVTTGIVSAFRYDTDKKVELVQTDTALNPGNSGGPLLTAEGLIVGINTYGIAESSGLNFAILETTVQERIAALIAGGSPIPPEPPAELRLTSLFGPESGHIHHEPLDGFIEGVNVGLQEKDILVDAWFQNPYDGSGGTLFDYGFQVRSSTETPNLRFAVVSNGYWRLWKRIGQTNETLASGTSASVRSGYSEWNRLSMGVWGNSGWVYLNGEVLAGPVDLGQDTGAGEVYIGTGFFFGDEQPGAITHYWGFEGLIFETGALSDGAGAQVAIDQSQETEREEPGTYDSLHQEDE